MPPTADRIETLAAQLQNIGQPIGLLHIVWATPTEEEEFSRCIAPS